MRRCHGGINGIHACVRLTVAGIVDETRRRDKGCRSDERFAARIHRAAAFASATGDAVAEKLILGKLLGILQIFESVDLAVAVVASSPRACR